LDRTRKHTDQHRQFGLVIGPVAISTIYFMSRASFPGLVWLIGASLYLLCLPVLMRKPVSAS
jgi:DHA1 family tetracycline resistance protein-like MFS transporter